MSAKNKIIISVIVIATAFALGRYATPEKIKTEEKIVEVEKVVTKVVRVVVTVKENPDGSKETTSVTESRTDSSTTAKNTESKSEETKSKKTVNVSLLTGTQLPPNLSLIYGLSVSSNLVGPITMGAWGLTNSTLGISIGLNL